MTKQIVDFTRDETGPCIQWAAWLDMVKKASSSLYKAARMSRDIKVLASCR